MEIYVGRLWDAALVGPLVLRAQVSMGKVGGGIRREPPSFFPSSSPFLPQGCLPQAWRDQGYVWLFLQEGCLGLWLGDLTCPVPGASGRAGPGRAGLAG